MHELIKHLITTHNITITNSEDSEWRECYDTDMTRTGISFILLKRRIPPWGPTLIIQLRKGISTAKRTCQSESQTVNLNDPDHLEQALKITEDYLIKMG